MGDLTADFSAHEFACPCCGRTDMNRRTVGRLQRVRSRYGRRMDIVEGGGFRCEKYENSATSAHRTGEAVDPGIPREDLFGVIKLAFEEGFTGIGVKNKGGRWQLHLDDAPAIAGVRPRPRVWTY